MVSSGGAIMLLVDAVLSMHHYIEQVRIYNTYVSSEPNHTSQRICLTFPRRCILLRRVGGVTPNNLRVKDIQFAAAQFKCTERVRQE